MSLLTSLIKIVQNRINNRNRLRLTNLSPTIIASNCTGGMIYHWLGLQFQSPFINLWMRNEDFLYAMEHFDDFISTSLTQDTQTVENYPVAAAWGGVRIYFLHYKTWDEAIEKWESRKKRIDKTNMCIMLSNVASSSIDYQKNIIDRFQKLPFKNKVCFVDNRELAQKDVIYLKGYNISKGQLTFQRVPFRFKRFIDQWDYVAYLNELSKNK